MEEATLASRSRTLKEERALGGWSIDEAEEEDDDSALSARSLPNARRRASESASFVPTNITDDASLSVLLGEETAGTNEGGMAAMAGVAF